MEYLKCFVISVLIMWSATCVGQEQELDLVVNSEVALQHNLEKNWPTRAAQGGSLALPFFDDFSRYSFPTNNPDIPAEWRRWEDNTAHINCHIAIAPPSVGVATLDGLAEDGSPYAYNCPQCYGPADTLTSRAIDLSGLSEDNNVYMSFYYQTGGRGNEPEPADSLVLEFYAPSIDEWLHKWSIPGEDLTDFQRVFVEIADSTALSSLYFDQGFKFRFRNYATLGGNVDHWLIDYIYLAEDIDPEDLNIPDLAYMECESTMLLDFTAMPWTHFKESPSAFLIDTSRAAQRNLGLNDINFQSGYKVEYESLEWNHPNDFSNTTNNANQIISPQTFFPVSDDLYDTSVNDTCALFTVKHYHEITDGFPQNDTMSFVQNFTNYYAYDDGTAERAYALNTAGGKLAMRFQIAEDDTLLGLFMHFTPFITDNSNQNFLLRAWASDGGLPGAEIGENFNFHSPEYFTSGLNKFAYYEYDAPMPVSAGPLFVGWVQDSNSELNIGNDKNGSANTAFLYYQLGLGTTWQLSGITGALMIRPVFTSGKSNVWNSVDDLLESTFSVFPNPADEMLHIQPNTTQSAYNLHLLDMTGRLVMQDVGLRGKQTLSVNHLVPGLYLLRLSGSGQQGIHKILIR